MGVPVRPGHLRHRVDVQRRGEIRTDTGASTPAWESLGTRWASIEPLSGRELEVAQSVDARVTHAIDLRYVHMLDPSCRIMWINRGRVVALNVVSVLNVDSRNVLSRVLAVEQVGVAS